MLQNDLKLKEIIQKQFANAQLYPQPNEGLFIPSHSTLIQYSVDSFRNSKFYYFAHSSHSTHKSF